MSVPLLVLGALVLLHMASLAEQWGARRIAPKGAIYWKVAEDEQGNVWVRYVGKSKRPAGRQSGHKAKALRDNEVWRLGDMVPFRFCWSARQESRIERRRILALAAFYRWRKVVHPRRPSRLENIVLNRKPRSLAEYLTVYAALTCYLAESFVYRPSRTWATPRRSRVEVAELPGLPAEPPVFAPSLPPAQVLGPGRNGPRFGHPSGSWSAGPAGELSPVAWVPPPPPVPSVLTGVLPSPAVPFVPRGAGDVLSPQPSVLSVSGPGSGDLPPPPPVPVKAKRPRRPKPVTSESRQG